MGFSRSDRDFDHEGERLAAWLYLPDRPLGEKPPVVIMAHGLAAERTFRLPAYAERFAEAGLAVFLFDYRNIGDSTGSPRGWVSPERHCSDWEAALRFVKTLPEIDPGRIALWGSSFSGGHVIVTAAEHEDLRAVVSQVPYVGSLDQSLPLRMQLRAAGALLLDKIASIFGGAYNVPPVGAPGEFGLMMAEEAREYMNLVPSESAWRNAVPARVLLEVPAYQPNEVAPRVTAPTLFVLGTRDETTPPEPVRECAATMRNAEVIEHECGHFDPYVAPLFDTIASEQTDFLVRHLGV